MNGRNCNHGSMALAGLLLLGVGACKDDAEESGAGEGEAAAEADEAAAAEAGAEAEAKPAKVEPPPPPPTGHAVAKVGALLFTSSTGEVGVELPPLGEGLPAGVTVNVVGAQDDRLVVETLAAQPAEHHCAASLSGLSDFRLRLFMAEDDLLPVLTEELVHENDDGTRIQVMRGVPVPEGEETSQLAVLGTTVPVTVPADALGITYEPKSAFPTTAKEGTIPELEGHPLTVGGAELAEDGLMSNGVDAVAHYGVTAKEGADQSLVTVRNPCLEVVALVDDERLNATTVTTAGVYALKGPMGAIPSPGEGEAGILGMMAEESGHFLASPYGEAFAEGGSDEDVWGGLTGTEAGEAFGVGGLGLVGTGRGSGIPSPEYEVKAGVAIVWADGSAAGQVIADHQFSEAPRDQDGRSCFDVPLTEQEAPTVTLCFAPGDVREVEGSGGGGLIGLGTGLIGKGSGGGGSGYGTGSGAGFGGRGKKVPRVRQGKHTVKGSLDKDIIRRIVRAHINEVRYCYNQGLVRDPVLEGQVSIQFTIGPTGKVPVSVVASTTVKDKNVGKCVAKAVKRWKFPKPPGGGNAVVTYPFNLSPG